MRDSDPTLERTRKPAASRGRSARIRESSPRLAERARPATIGADPRRWFVKLELEQADLAQIYKQGLLDHAEVWRQGSWRPLVTTQELRGVLHAPRRPHSSQRKSSPRSAPPPPPVGAASVGVRLAELARRYGEPVIVEPSLSQTRERLESFSDFEDTLVRVVPSAALALTPPALAPPVEILPPQRPRARTVSQASQASQASQRVRAWELVLVALASVLFTLAAVRAIDVQRGVHASLHAAQVAPTTSAASAASAAKPAAAPAIPVVELADLPLAGAHTRAASERAPSERAPSERAPSERSAAASVPARATPGAVARAASAGPDRATLAAALARAARSARSCGDGPELARVIVSYGPSGVPRSVRFGAVAPSRSLRSCVLSAMSRAVIPPFTGEPVTVEKSISW